MPGAAVTPNQSLSGRLARLLAYRTLVKYLVLKDIKVKSRGTYLGVAWTLLNPLFTIIVYFVIFRHVFRVAIPNYLPFFLLGFLMWVFFSRSISAAAQCILASGGIVKQSPFPLETLPLATVLYHLFHHAVALGIALPLMFIFWDVKPGWGLVWVGLVLLAFVGFTLAAALWLATLGVFFRDSRDILEVALPILFWGTPIFYTTEMAPGIVRPILAANPLSSFIVAARVSLLEGQTPSLEHVLGMGCWLVLALASGVWVFSRYSPRFVEEL